MIIIKKNNMNKINNPKFWQNIFNTVEQEKSVPIKSQRKVDAHSNQRHIWNNPNSKIRQNHTNRYREKYSVEVYNEKDNTYTTYPNRHEAARQTGVASMGSHDRWFPADGSWHQGSHERKGWWTRQIIKGMPRPLLPQFQHHFGHNIQIKKPNGAWKTYTSISEAARSTGWNNLSSGILSKYNNGDVYCSKSGPFKGWQVRKI
tara:strand:+ start:743 stop:1351 length:609 start_codon:yes stop_codon:yes gene_type:complete